MPAAGVSMEIIIGELTKKLPNIIPIIITTGVTKKLIITPQ